MLTLIKNIHLHTPEDKGKQQLLIAGEKIIAIGEDLQVAGSKLNVVDAHGLHAMPGLIDQHVHIIGGGGQTGYFSLAPEVPLSRLIATGTTTVVGLLGTDGFVKTLPQLYAKTKAYADGVLWIAYTNYHLVDCGGYDLS